MGTPDERQGLPGPAPLKSPGSAAQGGVAILALLTVLNILNFTDRYLLQAFAVDFMADLHLSNFEFTLLTGFVFTIFYTVMAVLMGMLADHHDRPRLIAAGVAAWSLLTAVTGTVASLIQAVAARIFIGVGEATLTPAGLGLLADVMPLTRRAFAAGCYYLGAPVGIGGAYLIAGALGPVVGWRHCFLGLGIVGLVLTLPVLLLRDSRPLRPSRGPERSGLFATFLEALREIADRPALALLIAGATLVIFAQGALVLDQVWMVRERGFSTRAAQNLAGTLFLVGGTAGTLLGGWAGDFMEASRSGGRLRFLAGLYLVGIPVCYVYRFSDPQGLVFRLSMLGGSMVATMGYGPLFATLQDLAPERVRSTTTSIMILSMMVLGTSVANVSVGALADFLRAAGWGEPLTWAETVVMAPGLLAVPCFLVAARRVARG